VKHNYNSSMGGMKGAMTPYAYFVKKCRQDHKKKHPNQTVTFVEFSRKCAEKWRSLGEKQKAKYATMANRDRARQHDKRDADKAARKRKRSASAPRGGKKAKK
jgi:hypothetical protein